MTEDQEDAAVTELHPGLVRLLEQLRANVRAADDRDRAILGRRLPDLEKLRAAGYRDDQLRWVTPARGFDVRTGLIEFEGIRVVRLLGSTYGLLIRA